MLNWLLQYKQWLFRGNLHVFFGTLCTSPALHRLAGSHHLKWPRLHSDILKVHKPLAEECNLWGTKQEPIRRSQDRLVGLSLQSQTTKRITRSLLSDVVLPERLEPVLTQSPRQMQQSEKKCNMLIGSLVSALS